MNLSVKPIFLKENEKDIFRSLQNQGIDTTKFEHHFITSLSKMNKFIRLSYYLKR